MQRGSKPLLFVLSAVLLLVSLVAIFSFSPLSTVLEERGITFTNFSSIQENYVEPWFPKTEKTKSRKKNPTHEIQSKKTLSAADKLQIDTLKAKVQFLENFTLGKDNTCLSAFFESLRHTSDSCIHIWYYGDSQIEGDRVTQDFRALMQSRFGGSGLGYVPFSDVATYRTIELKCPSSWIKWNCFNNKSPKGYGFAGKVFKYKTGDSSGVHSTGIWISPKQKYDRLALLYGKSGGGKVTITGKDSGKTSVSLPSAAVAGKVNLSNHPVYGSIQVTLPVNTLYHGFLMESRTGVQVDNCGIRGHSGDGLAHIADDMIIRESSLLNTSLVVFHFGNNMVPYLKVGKKMDYYQKAFETMFRRYRKLMPNSSFLVVSAGDMGSFIDGEKKSYPIIPAFTDMLREAALNTGCAFFDMHAMMKKDGGILAWTKKGLASLDGHLSPSGQMYFARTLYQELMREYSVFEILTGTTASKK